jgi:hypothetical protein
LPDYCFSWRHVSNTSCDACSTVCALPSMWDGAVCFLVRLWGDDLTLMLFCAVNRYLMESVAYFLGHINLSMALLDMPPKPSPCARSLQHHKKRPWCCWAPDSSGRCSRRQQEGGGAAALAVHAPEAAANTGVGVWRVGIGNGLRHKT